MDTRILNETSAETFVANNKYASWEGWDILMFSPNSRAYTSPRGVYNRTLGKWGFQRKVSPDNSGLWRIRVGLEK